MGDEGLEPLPKTKRKTTIRKTGAAQSAAVGEDSELRAVVEAWPSLDPQVRATILKLVLDSNRKG